MPNIVHSGGGVNIMTLPDQITNLACVGGTDGTAGTIDVSFTEVPSSSWSLLQNYLLVYKAGGIPQTPFDGTRVVLPKGTAGAQKTYQITGLTVDRLYGVRIYPVSTRYQHQTAAEGATGTATPVNGIKLGELPINTLVRIESSINFIKIAKDHTGFPYGSNTLFRKTLKTGSLWSAASNRIYKNAPMRTYLNGTYITTLPLSVQNSLMDTTRPDATNGAYTDKVFILTAKELGYSVGTDGYAIDFFSDNSSRIALTDSGVGGFYWSPTVINSNQIVVVADTGANSIYSTALANYYLNNTVYASGGSYNVYSRWGINLPDDFLLSAVPNADGSYNPI